MGTDLKKFNECCNLICRLETTDNVSKQQRFVLKDFNGTKIKLDNLSNALSIKSIRYCNKRKKQKKSSEAYLVWILRAKTEKNTTHYINIAVCKNINNLLEEINSHIKLLLDLIKKGTKKSNAHLDLCKRFTTFDFLEIDTDKYFESFIDNDCNAITEPYITSLVSTSVKPEEKQALLIWKKNRAEYIEGRLAHDFKMAENYDLWHDSSLGLDGFIYEYYGGKRPSNKSKRK